MLIVQRNHITRRKFLEHIAAGSLAGVVAYRSSAEDVSGAADGPLFIPYPPKPWAQAIRLVGDRPQRNLNEINSQTPGFSRLPLYNDFCLFTGTDGQWHCVGCLFEGSTAEDFRQDRLFHYVADSVQGPYRSLGYVDLGYGKGSGVWAPCIVQSQRRVLIFYAYATPGIMNSSIRIGEALDPHLQSWRRGIAGSEILATEQWARDPEIIRDRHTGLYLMYYVAHVQNEGVVRVRTSSDLLSWSQPRTVLGTPTGYGEAESVFVLQRRGYYYMWISGYDYSVMSLYISMNPFNFGDAAANRIEEQPGHAAEIVHSDDRYWMACSAIASVPGLPVIPDLPLAQHDLEGIYLQPLEWRVAPPEAMSRVVRG
jgi:hypothetical protein